MSVNAEDLGKLAAPDTDEFEDEVGDEIPIQDELQSASDLLKSSAVLFEYLSNPDFTKTVSKRERAAIERQLTKIYELTERVDELLSDGWMSV